MGAPEDRVQLLKTETPSQGGTQDDVGHPAILNPHEDGASVRGIFLQKYYASHPWVTDELVYISRDASGNLTFKDDVVSGEKTLSQLLTAASPAGADKQIQFNDGGSAFGADADFTWDKTANQLDVNGDIRIVADNKKLILGAGQDVELYFDGTQSIFQAGSTNGLAFFLGGTTPPPELTMVTGSWGLWVKDTADDNRWVGVDDKVSGILFTVFDLTNGHLFNAGANPAGYNVRALGGDMHLGDDNDQILMGTGDDASLYYDGTHLCLDPKEVGTGQFWIKGSVKGVDTDHNASGDGALCFGYKAGGTKTIRSTGDGAILLGAATGSGGVTFESTGYGTIALGRCSGYDAHGKLKSTGSGSLACGHVGTEGTDAILESTGYGSVALGRSETNWTAPFPPNAATLTSQNHGSMAGGYAQGYSGGSAALLKSSGVGSFVWGHAYGGTHQATGTAAVAMGKNLQATANYAFSFGRDFTNSQSESFCVGFGQKDFDVRSNGVRLPKDSHKLYFGAGDDLEIYHDGTNGYVKPTTGYLVLPSIKSTTGDPTGVEGMLVINTSDNNIKFYADSAWRTLVSW